MEHTFNLRQIFKKKKRKKKEKKNRKKGRKEGRKEGRKKEREKKKERYFPKKKKRRNQSGQWWHMPLIAALGKQRQTD